MIAQENVIERDAALIAQSGAIHLRSSVV